MNLDFYNKNGYSLVENKEYGYIHVSPLPSDEELKNFYSKYFSNDESFNNSSLKVQQTQAYYTNSRWEIIYKRFFQFFSGKCENKSLIDIGCGFAQAILFFKEKGFSVKGIEPSKQAVDYAINNNLDVENLEIEAFLKSYSGEKYDVVTMFEVLEHLKYPEKILLNIKNNLLNKDGLLAIDVPNDFNDFQVIADKEYNLNNWWVSPPAHLNYFSVKSLKRLLELCGFEIMYMQSSFPLEMFMLMGDIYVGDNASGTSCHEKRVKFERLLRENGKEDLLIKYYEALAELNLGRNITIFAKIK